MVCMTFMFYARARRVFNFHGLHDFYGFMFFTWARRVFVLTPMAVESAVLVHFIIFYVHFNSSWFALLLCFMCCWPSCGRVFVSYLHRTRMLEEGFRYSPFGQRIPSYSRSTINLVRGNASEAEDTSGPNTKENEASAVYKRRIEVFRMICSRSVLRRSTDRSFPHCLFRVFRMICGNNNSSSAQFQSHVCRRSSLGGDAKRQNATSSSSCVSRARKMGRVTTLSLTWRERSTRDVAATTRPGWRLLGHKLPCGSPLPLPLVGLVRFIAF